jgi:predicted NBD/HSP70 family sugar kinase
LTPFNSDFNELRSRDVVRLVRAGDARAIALVRESGRLIGEALASAVNLLNPRVIVVGGDIAQADQHLLPGIKEFIYQRSLALSTQHLRIVRSRLNDRAEIAGAAAMVIDHILSPEVVDRVILA